MIYDIFQKQLSENRRMALNGELSSLLSELKSDMYKNAGTKFRDKMIVLKVGCLPYFLVMKL